MIRKSLLLTPSLLLLLGTSIHATDNDAAAPAKLFKSRLVVIEADLKGAEEVPVASSPGASGHFKAIIDEQNATIQYELSYSGLEGQVLAGHVHVGQMGVNGGIPLFACANAPALPPATVTIPAVQPCPPAPATVTGTWTGADIIPLTTQGIGAQTPEELQEIINLMKAGLVYANVHTTRSPGGEIRGQVRRDLFPFLKKD